MELDIKKRKGRIILESLPTALCFTLLWLSWLSAGELEGLTLPVLGGGALVLCLTCLDRKKRRLGALILMAATLLLGLVFHARAREGLAAFANGIFSASESRQAYEYDYFSVKNAEPLWGVCFLLGLTAGAAVLWKRAFLLPMGGVAFLTMAYFGITPGAVWFGALLFAGAWLCLPGREGWKFLLPLALGAVILTVALGSLAPSSRLSTGEERLRDSLALRSVTYERVPKEEISPETEPPPPTEPLEEAAGEEPGKVNVLFLLLAALTLLLLFVPAIIRDNAQRRRARQREDFRSENAALAIRAMYLHGRRWAAVSREEKVCPGEIYALWQEAAFSDHSMTEAQREKMETYLEELEREVWEKSDKITRFRIKYQLAL